MNSNGGYFWAWWNGVFTGDFEFFEVWLWWICGQGVVDWVDKVVFGRTAFQGVWILQIFEVYFRAIGWVSKRTGSFNLIYHPSISVVRTQPIWEISDEKQHFVYVPVAGRVCCGD